MSELSASDPMTLKRDSIWSKNHTSSSTHERPFLLMVRMPVPEYLFSLARHFARSRTPRKCKASRGTNNLILTLAWRLRNYISETCNHKIRRWMSQNGNFLYQIRHQKISQILLITFIRRRRNSATRKGPQKATSVCLVEAAPVDNGSSQTC